MALMVKDLSEMEISSENKMSKNPAVYAYIPGRRIRYSPDVGSSAVGKGIAVPLIRRM